MWWNHVELHVKNNRNSNHVLLKSTIPSLQLLKKSCPLVNFLANVNQRTPVKWRHESQNWQVVSKRIVKISANQNFKLAAPSLINLPRTRRPLQWWMLGKAQDDINMLRCVFFPRILQDLILWELSPSYLYPVWTWWLESGVTGPKALNVFSP